jgi:hypothetical protein
MNQLLAKKRKILKKTTYEITPVVIFGVGSCFTPFSSIDGRISNTCRVEAIVRKALSFARYRPGQTLKICKERIKHQKE